MSEKIYFCDPNKNTECSKTDCFTRGGECCKTSHPEFKGEPLKVPKIDWILFDKDNPPANLYIDTKYLIILREDNYDDGASWNYSIDIATPCRYLMDDFWDTENDWNEGQRVEVIAYAELPCSVKEDGLVEVEA